MGRIGHGRKGSGEVEVDYGGNECRIFFSLDDSNISKALSPRTDNS